MTYVGTVVGWDSAQGNAQNATSLSWSDVITNTPSGATAINAGDRAYIFWTHTQGSSEATIPSGFSQIGTRDDTGLTYSVYERVCSGGETGGIGTIGAGATQRQTWILVVVRGYSGVNQIVSVADAGTDANHTNPSATPTVADVGVLIGDGSRVGAGPTSTTAPAGYTIITQTSTDTTNRNLGAVAYEGSGGNISGTHTAGVAISPGTWVDNASVADNVTFTILLTPASVSYSTTGALSGTDSITGAGVRGFFTTGSLAATAALAGAAVLGLSSTGSIAATVSLAGDGVVGKASTGSLSATGAVSGAGVLGRTGTGSLAATATVAGDGVVARSGSGSVAGTDSITGTGSAGYNSTGSLAATDSLAGGGVLGKSSTGSLAGTAALSGNGVVAKTSTGSLAATVSITGDGATSGSGSSSGTLPAVGTLTGDGVVARSSSGNLAGSDSLTGAGVLGRYSTGNLTITVTLAGNGVLGATSDATIPAVAQILGDGMLGLSETGNLAAVAALTGDGAVEGVSAGDPDNRILRAHLRITHAVANLHVLEASGSLDQPATRGDLHVLQTTSRVRIPVARGELR